MPARARRSPRSGTCSMATSTTWETQYNSRLRKRDFTKARQRWDAVRAAARSARLSLQLPRGTGRRAPMANQDRQAIRAKQLEARTWKRLLNARSFSCAKLHAVHHLHRRLALSTRRTVFDFYGLRHFGASYMLNVLVHRALGHRGAAPAQRRGCSSHQALRSPNCRDRDRPNASQLGPQHYAT